MNTRLTWAILAALAVSIGAIAHAEEPIGAANDAPDEPVYQMMATKTLSGGVSKDVFGLSDDIATAQAQVDMNPDDPEAHFMLGIAYSRTPYVEMAITELRRARKLAKAHPQGFALFDKKIAEYEKLLEGSPDDPMVLYRLAFGYYFKGYGIQHHYLKDETDPHLWYDRAKTTMRRLVEVDNSDTAARNYLGFILIEQDATANFDEAVALWEESLAIDARNNPAACALLGQAYLKQGRLKQAVEYTTKAIQSRNDWLEANHIDATDIFR